jgi:4-amino-4-deoxy-L-arabinose transferase-like glycosyltransferase
LGRRYFGKTTGVLAGSITALYGPLLFWESELVAAGWAAFWTVALLLLALRIQQRGSLGSYFAFGLVGGVAVLTRPSFLPFVLLSIAWFGWSGHRAAETRMLGKLAAASLGFLFLALPTAVASHRIANHASFLPRAGALNLYIGNNPERCETLQIRPGTDWQELQGRATREGFEERPEQTRFFRDQVLDYATTAPRSFVSGILHKLVQFANGREIPRNVDVYSFREWSPMLSALVWKIGDFGFPWGLLFPLALVGLALKRKTVPAPLLILIASYPLVIALTFVAGRYRVPMVPAMSILAAVGIAEFAARVMQRRWRSVLYTTALVIALGFATNRSNHFCEEDFNFPAEMYLALAVEANQNGSADDAVVFFRQALDHDPDSQRAHTRLAEILFDQKKIDLAIEHYDQAIRISEHHWLFHRRGIAYRLKGEFLRAMKDFDAALALKPDYALSHQQQGEVYFRLGKPKMAKRSILLASEHANDERAAKQARATLEWLERQEQ